MLNKKLEALLEIAVKAEIKKSPGEITAQKENEEKTAKENAKKGLPLTNAQWAEKNSKIAKHELIDRLPFEEGKKLMENESEVKPEEKIPAHKADPEFIKKFQKKNPNWNGDWVTKKQLESNVEPEPEPEEFMESYTQKDLLELFEALKLDTDKYTFEYLAEELGFIPLNENPPLMDDQPKSSENVRTVIHGKTDADEESLKKKDGKEMPSATASATSGGVTVNSEIPAAKYRYVTPEQAKAEIASNRAQGIDTNEFTYDRTGDNWNKSKFSPKKTVSESYSRKDLLELFEALKLDTEKYTFSYLAEELGFVPEGEVKMQQPEMAEMQPSQDPAEYDEEGSMAKSQLITIADAAAELYNMMEDETNLPEWVQSKLTLSKEYIDTVRDYLKSEMIKQSQDMAEMQPQPEMEQVPVEMPVEQSLQEKYVLKRPVGRPSAKSKMLDAKGASEVDSKGQVVYTNKKNGGK
jgi:hypothetical protein